MKRSQCPKCSRMIRDDQWDKHLTGHIKSEHNKYSQNRRASFSSDLNDDIPPAETNFAAANPNLVTGKHHRARLNFDGACKPNPGQASCGWILRDGDRIIDSGRRDLGYGTNNIAEYQGLIFGLACALDNDIDILDVYGDSQIVINRIGNKVKKPSKPVPHLVPLIAKARELVSQFQSITFTWVGREDNSDADALA